MTTLLASPRPLRQAAVCFLGLLLIASPAFAHHPFGMGDSNALTAWQGLLSGLGHPLLGPDHLLFLLALGFVGLQRPLRWVLPLLAVVWVAAFCRSSSPCPMQWPWAEALVSLSLAAEGLIALTVAPPVGCFRSWPCTVFCWAARLWVPNRLLWQCIFWAY